MIKRLDWDSDFFEIEVGELTNQIICDNENLAKFDLLYYKNQENLEIEINGFTNSFQETKVVFGKNITKTNFESKEVISIKSVNYNLHDIYNLAFESGKFSRFFLDKYFKKEKFQELYKKWVDNSISNIFADDLLVYRLQNQIIGFVTYKIQNKEATIGLIAVSKDFQGKGIGSLLLKHLEALLFKSKIKKLMIPTQELNAGACNFYKKQGYTIHQKTFIKHYWKK